MSDTPRTSPVEGVVSQWCPDRCPITMLPFFMWIEHPEKGMVPTYGGPLDSYTIPEPANLPDEGGIDWHDIELTRERYDHDAGGWVDGCESVTMRLVTEEKLSELNVWPELKERETPKEILASRLIDAWCEAHGKKIPWAKAVEIVAIVTELPVAERERLLNIGDG